MPINMQIALSPFGSWGGCGSERFRDFSTAIQLANGSQDRNLISKSPGHSFTERCQWTMAWRRNLTHCLMLKMKIYCNTTPPLALQLQGWVVVTKTIWSTSLKYLLSRPLQKKFSNQCFTALWWALSIKILNLTHASFLTRMLKINFPCGNILPKYFHLEASVLVFFYHNNSQ